MKSYLAATPDQLGPLIAGYRKKKGLTQKELGSFVGLSQSAVSEIEANPGKASVARLYRLLSGLQVDILLTERSNPLVDVYRSSYLTESNEAPEW